MFKLLDPKVDFVFKSIFGSKKNSNILISLLNATLKPSKLITKVEIKNGKIGKQFVEDKYSILDIKATTSNNEVINIDIQLKNGHNMIKRSIDYLSKFYEEQLCEGGDNSRINRTVCINILNFKYLATDKFHTAYRLKELYSNEELIDAVEIHFIEIAKLPMDSDEKDMLVAWTEFLKNPNSVKVRNLEMTVKEIREAKDELVKMSDDDEQRKIYEVRVQSLRDEISAVNKATEEGIKIGRELVVNLNKRTILKNLLNKKFKSLGEDLVEKLDNLPIEIIENITEDLFDINNFEDLEKFFDRG